MTSNPLSETPNANRVRIAFFGLRNAGKSTLVNAFCGQPVAIVSDTPGTTTDPVSKAMEILPLGPCLITDTAGLDDTGELGGQRVRRTLDVLETSDVAVWVGDDDWSGYPSFASRCEALGIPLLRHRRGDDTDALRDRIAALRLKETEPGLLDGLVRSGDKLILVCPIDAAAPKGRLILPQVQVLRDALDRHATATVCQVAELADALSVLTADGSPVRIITDSQAFAQVRAILRESKAKSATLTSFSILFARQKGDLAAYGEGVAAACNLKSGDRVVVAEGCTHRRQCGDIGTVKIPHALEKLCGHAIACRFASGTDFLNGEERPALVVHCGGCMLTRREMQRRIRLCRERGVPIVNYGVLLAAAAGATLQPGTCDLMS